MICPNCGAEIEENLNQCPVCDYQIEENEAIQQPETEQDINESANINSETAKPKTQRNVPFIVVSVICVILVIVIGVMAYFMLDNKSNGVEDNISAISTLSAESEKFSDNKLDEKSTEAEDDSSISENTVTTTTAEETTTTSTKETTTTTEETTTTTEETTTTTTTTAEPTTTEPPRTDFSLYSGTYTLNDNGEVHTLDLSIDQNGNYYWTYTFQSPRIYSQMSNSGVADNAKLYYDGVIDDYGLSNSGYVELTSYASVDLCIGGAVYTLYK